MQKRGKSTKGKLCDNSFTQPEDQGEEGGGLIQPRWLGKATAGRRKDAFLTLRKRRGHP